MSVPPAYKKEDMRDCTHCISDQDQNIDEHVYGGWWFGGKKSNQDNCPQKYGEHVYVEYGRIPNIRLHNFENKYPVETNSNANHDVHMYIEDVSRHMYIFIYTWICMGVSQQYKKRIGMSATPHSNSNQEIAPKTMVNMFVYVDYGHTPNIHTNKGSALEQH